MFCRELQKGRNRKTGDAMVEEGGGRNDNSISPVRYSFQLESRGDDLQSTSPAREDVDV